MFVGMNKHLQMFLGHESGSFTLADVVFTQSSTWRTPGKPEPECSHTWPALRAWQLKGPYRTGLFTALSKHKQISQGWKWLLQVCFAVQAAQPGAVLELTQGAAHSAGHILPSPGTQHSSHTGLCTSESRGTNTQGNV